MAAPGVKTNEKDVSFYVSSSVSSASSMVGLFKWGPVNEGVQIQNDTDLLKQFGRPDNTVSQFFHSAVNYLLYVNPLFVVRAIDSNVALNAVPTAQTPVLLKNEADYASATLTGISVVARYPGALGNAIKISAADDTAFSTWAYKSNFTFTPESGEFNMVVIDATGEITGTAGTVLETYELMSKTAGAKKPDGTTAYVVNAVKDQSSYIYIGDETAINFAESGSLGVYEDTLQGGVDGNDQTTADFTTAIGVLSNKTNYDIISSMASLLPSAAVGTLIDTLDTRQDSVAFCSPTLASVYNNPTAEADVATYFNTTINKNTSYAFYDNNWKMVYDKYNDKNIWIPCDSDCAALWSLVFANNQPYMSMAGLNRGQLKNVIKLAWNADEDQQSSLYDSSINSIISLKGEGTVLFGDKTALKRPSAFNRINVRGLFIVLKKNIARAARYQLFELNDQITRTIFRNATNRYLGGFKRGIERYLVVCDETNNTATVINNNDFVGDIYIDPSRSINNIRLNFVAVAQGVSFTEIEGV